MRYFYDTEFIEDGTQIELVSIGIVAEDGREYYAVSTDFDCTAANPWVHENVLTQLPNPSDSVWKPLSVIREEVGGFLSAYGRPQLWAWVGAYDHIVLAQLFGDMAALPANFPRMTLDIKQYWMMAGRPALPKKPAGTHDALVDARFNRTRFEACMEALPINESGRVLL